MVSEKKKGLHPEHVMKSGVSPQKLRKYRSQTPISALICTPEAPSLLISSGHSPRLGGTIFVWGGTNSHLRGHGPGMPPPRGAGPGLHLISGEKTHQFSDSRRRLLSFLVFIQFRRRNYVIFTPRFSQGCKSVPPCKILQFKYWLDQ